MGQDKAWIDVFGEPAICRIVRLLSRHAETIVIAAGPDQSLPPLSPSVQLLRDRERHLGPLSGLATALTSTALSNVDWAFVTAVDNLGLDDETVEWFVGHARAGESVLARCDNTLQPIPGLYWLDDLRNRVKVQLSEGRRSLRHLLATIRYRELTDPPSLEAFAACNDPDEFDALIKRLGSSPE